MTNMHKPCDHRRTVSNSVPDVKNRAGSGIDRLTLLRIYQAWKLVPVSLAVDVELLLCEAVSAALDGQPAAASQFAEAALRHLAEKAGRCAR